MKTVRNLGVALLVTLLFGCALLQKPAQPIEVGPLIEKPAALKDALVTLTISDVQGFLDGAGTVAAQVSPLTTTPMLKMMLGSKLGDPQLAGFAPGKGFAVVVMDEGNMFMVAEVDAAHAETYVKQLQAMGKQAEAIDGLVLAGKDINQLKTAERLAGTVRTDLLEANRSPSIRIAFQPADLISKNEEKISKGLQKELTKMQQVSAATGTAQTRKILEAEIRALLSVGRQIDSMEVKIEPVNGAINVSEIVQPVTGSRLSALCNAPVLYDFNPRLQSGVFADGAINMEWCMRNPEAYTAFLAGECNSLAETMPFDKTIADSWVKYMNRWMGEMGGTVCESIFSGSGKRFEFSCLKEVKDEAAMLNLLRNMPADMADLGLLRLYQAAGMPMTVEFKENVRKHAGVKIHQLKMNFSTETRPVEQRELLGAMIGDMTCDLAFYKNVLIYTMGDGEIEKVIDRLKNPKVSPAALAARSGFPAGGIYYADLDIGKYFAFIAALSSGHSGMPGSMQKIAETLAGAEPVTMVGFCNNGRMKADMQIPGGVLVRIAQAGQMIAVESMQKRADLKAEKEEQQIGNKAPDVTLNVLDGASVKLSDHIGKQVVVIDFWASWCGPCRKGLPVVQKTAEQFAGADVVFYAINLREDEAAIKTFFQKTGLTLPVVMDDGTLGKAFGVSGIPHTVIIDKNGIIQAVHVGLSGGFETQLPAEITAALSKGT